MKMLFTNNSEKAQLNLWSP